MSCLVTLPLLSLSTTFVPFLRGFVDRTVSVTFFMAAMPAMGMAAMKTVIDASDKGGGMYEGRGDLGSGGTWQVTIHAQQNGQTIANKQLTVNATGGM